MGRVVVERIATHSSLSSFFVVRFLSPEEIGHSSFFTGIRSWMWITGLCGRATHRPALHLPALFNQKINCVLLYSSHLISDEKGPDGVASPYSSLLFHSFQYLSFSHNAPLLHTECVRCSTCVVRLPACIPFVASEVFSVHSLSRESFQRAPLVPASSYSPFSSARPQAEEGTDTKLVQLRLFFEMLECDVRLHVGLLRRDQSLARQRRFSARQLTERARPEVQIKWAALLRTAVGHRPGAGLFGSFSLTPAAGFVSVDAVFTRGASGPVGTHGFTPALQLFGSVCHSCRFAHSRVREMA